MTIKNTRKLGFIAALTMLLGSVVGIGIFFKNGSVFRAVDDNGISALIAWIIGGILALAAAISFSEIGSMKTKNVHGLAAWAEKLGGKKYGYFVRTTFSVFYFSFMQIALGAFVSEGFFQFIHSTGALSQQPPIWAHAIVGLSLSAVVTIINRISIKTSGWTATITTVLKFIPLLVALVIGLVFAGAHNDGGSNIMTHGKMSFTGILAALPAILFAYDAFLNVGTLSAKTKGGTKTVSKVVVIGMITVITLYSLIAISSILHGSGSVGSVITDSLPSAAASGLNTFVYFFIFVSAYGVLNGMTAGYVASFEQAYSTNTIFGSKTIKNKYGDKKGFDLLILVNSIFTALIVYVPAIILRSDAYIDAITNFPTLFFFGVYASVIALYLKNKTRVQTKQINRVLFNIAAVTAVAGIFIIVIYQLVYGFTISAFINPDAPSHSGLFATFGRGLDSIQFFGVFVALLVIFTGIAPLNWYLVRRFENHNPIKDTQKETA